MASKTLSEVPWADGTLVGVYPAVAQPRLDGAPAGAAVATATVASRAVTFTGLTERVQYVAYAGGISRRFVIELTTAADDDRQRLIKLEAALVDKVSVPVNANDHLAGGVSRTAALTAAWNKAQAEGRALYVPAGAWDFSGAALVPAGTDWHIFGDGRGRTVITLAAGQRLIDSSVLPGYVHMHDLSIIGGLGTYRCTSGAANVNGDKIIERVVFDGYTGCNWEARESDEPFWTFRDCRFKGLDYTATMALALGGGAGQRLLDQSLIEHCSFNRNRYDVKLSVGGNVQIKDCDFEHFDTTTPGDRAYLWFIPDTDLTNPGIGMLCSGTKFGSEFAAVGDHVVLYADEDAASGVDWGTRGPDLTHDSTGVIVGHTFRDCNFNGAVGVRRSPIFSTTPHVRGCSYSGVIEAPTGMDYFFEFRTPPASQDERNVSNTLGPLRSDTLGVSSTVGLETIPKLTNAPGFFYISDPTGQWAGRAEAPASFPGGSNSAEYVRLLAQQINGFTAIGASKSVVTDAMGGQDAMEIAFAAATDSYWGQLAGAVTGRPVWVEFDVKNGAGGSPLGYVYMKLRRGGSGSSHIVRIVEADATWRTVRVLCPALRDVSVQPTVFFSTAAIGTVQIGRVRVYHAREPIAPDLIPDMPAVVSAGAIQLPPEGRAMAVSGTTTINHLAKAQPGRMVLLHFAASLTVTHNAGTVPSGYAPILLNGAANFAATANDVLALLYNGTSWVGISPGSNN